MSLVILAVVGLYVLGTLPRVRRQAALAADVRQVRTAIPEVVAVTPHLVPDGGLTLPGNIEAIRESAINARTTGYLRRLYVDIGSRVKAGQVLAEIESPDVDQQVYQALAQTAQSRATVGQSRATVAQQQANLAQMQAQVAQQRATVEQARAQLAACEATLSQQQAALGGDQAQLAHARRQVEVQQSSLKQAQAQLELAKVTDQRYQTLLKEGFGTQQDADQSASTLKTDAAALESGQASVLSAQADVESAQQTVEAGKALVASARANVESYRKNVQASVAALASSEATVRAAEASVRASQANVQANQATVASNQANARHYDVMRSFEKVLAPFDGVITARNVDVGALINAGGGGGNNPATSSITSTGMLGIARTDDVRIQVSIPQTYVPAVRAGSSAQVTVRELPGRAFSGTVTLRAGALDAATRTQLVEVHLPNRDHVLVPGMYADVRLTPSHAPAHLQIPGSALVVDAQGTRVASVGPKGNIHYLSVQVGRDLGAEVEIRSGLRGGEKLVDSPPDTLTEGTAVRVLPPQRLPQQEGVLSRRGGNRL
jgi:RND family efflux transporter MFP subunit